MLNLVYGCGIVLVEMILYTAQIRSQNIIACLLANLRQVLHLVQLLSRAILILVCLTVEHHHFHLGHSWHASVIELLRLVIVVIS